MKKILAAVLFLSFGSTAFAQLPIEGKLEAGLGLFNGIPVSSDLDDNFDGAFGFELFADYNVAENVFAGIEFGRSLGYDGKASVGYADLDETYFGVRGKYIVPLQNNFSAYGLLGIANYWWDADGVSGDNGLGCSFGFGLNYDFQRDVYIGAEWRYHFSSKYDTPMVDAKTNHMMLGLHAGYRF